MKKFFTALCATLSAAAIAGCSGTDNLATLAQDPSAALHSTYASASPQPASSSAPITASGSRVTATVAASTWTTIFDGWNSATQIYTKRSKADPCGFVPATAASGYQFPTTLNAGQSVTIVGQLVNSAGAATPTGGCPYQILAVTSVSGVAPTPVPSPKPSPTPTPAASSTYWVSSTGNDNNAGTSSTTAFATIQRAVNVARAGQTITVENGKYTTCGTGTCAGVPYNVLFTASGTSNAARITLQAQNRDGAIIDGMGDPLRHCIGFNNNVAYVNIVGFHIQNCGGGIAGLGNAHDVLISHNEIDHIGTNGNCGTNGGYGYTGIGWNEAYNITVDGNYIHDVGESKHLYYCSYTSDHGMYIHGHDNMITNNVFYNNNSGWDIQLTGGPTGQNWLIANNTFGSHNNPNSPGSIVLYTGPGPNAPSKVAFENNVFGSTDTTAVLNCDYGAGSQFVAYNTLIQTSGIALTTGSCNMTAQANNQLGVNPEFTNAGVENFMPTASSPLLGGGMYDARIPTYNVTGAVRSMPWSVGAY
jgi:hypothetical protein